jgi:hypothetical protein
MVSEDGVRQDVRSLRLVAGSEVRVEDERQAAETQQAGRTAAPVNPLRTVNLVCIILSDLTPETRATAFSAARRFVNRNWVPIPLSAYSAWIFAGCGRFFRFSNNCEHLVRAVELDAINQLPSTGGGVRVVGYFRFT